MIAYFLKTIACSALLLLFYFLFLEREKMHRFNRYYLLFSIALSFIIPLISITTMVTQNLLPIEQSLNVPGNALREAIIKQTNPATSSQSYIPIFLWGVYLSVSIFLLYRFFKIISRIYYKIKSNASVPYYNAKLVLTTDKIVPHSFLHYIFIDKDAFENSTIEKEILNHELTHVRQRHSLDILFVELLFVFCWFNPILYLYRRFIQLNHEFLADDAVIKTFNDTKAYQYLLLERSSQAKSLSFTSQFNYLLTKKRLVMLTRTTSTGIAVLKELALLPIIAFAIFIFSTKTVAQEPAKAIPQIKKEVPSTVEGASPELMKEYADIVAKRAPNPNEKAGPAFKHYWQFTDTERDRLEEIFLKMSKMQQSQQTVMFWPKIPPSPKVVPTKTQFESFKDPSIYGVWIDGKKVGNDVLNKYSNYNTHL